jgi:hypothetical protein
MSHPFTIWVNKEISKRRAGDKELANYSGLSSSAIAEIRAGRLPTKAEIQLLKNALPALRHQRGLIASTLEEEEKQQRAREQAAREHAARPKPVTPEPPAPPPPPPAVTAAKRLIVQVQKAPKSQSSPDIESAGPGAIKISPLSIKTSTKEQYTTIEKLDPELARLLLEGNVRNRDVSGVHVDALARDMSEGRWQLTHQGLAFDPDGRLVDGQHRLYAIMRSGKTIEMSVTWNVDPKSFEVVDTGERPRSAVDVLRMADKNGTPLISVAANTATAAAVKVIASVVLNVRRARWSLGEIRESFEKYSEVAEVYKFCAKSNLTKRAGVLAGMTYAYPIYPDVVTDFCKRVASMEAMELIHAAFTKAVLRVGHGHEGNIELMLLSLRAIERCKKGDTSSAKLYTTKSGETEPQNDGSYIHFLSQRKKKGLCA